MTVDLTGGGLELADGFKMVGICGNVGWNAHGMEYEMESGTNLPLTICKDHWNGTPVYDPITEHTPSHICSHTATARQSNESVKLG